MHFHLLTHVSHKEENIFKGKSCFALELLEVIWSSRANNTLILFYFPQALLHYLAIK